MPDEQPPLPTPEQLEELKQLLSKATPGEWTVGQERGRSPEDAGTFVQNKEGHHLFDTFNRDYRISETMRSEGEGGRWLDIAGEKDLELVAALHDLTPSLIRAAEEREKMAEYIRRDDMEDSQELAAMRTERDALQSRLDEALKLPALLRPLVESQPRHFGEIWIVDKAVCVSCGAVDDQIMMRRHESGCSWQAHWDAVNALKAYMLAEAEK